MRWFWEKLGIVIHFFAWPFIKPILNNSVRTRVLIMVGGTYILVVKGWLGRGKWELPGGGLHKDETRQDCAVREVKEELGFNIDPEELRFITDYTHSERGITATLSFFRVDLPQAIPLKLQRHEIIDAKWLKTDEITEANSSPDLYMAVKEYLRPETSQK